ncbi:hypothetical protein G7Z17_g11853 [Cylindrodendrum hubeiense]|uniref:Uncharacterized protein n=1 Tax=Cylindrodendrum hubeiense TaxID=595255 RepID=A0A9P5GWE1_9HYPO|nr:hypothetical protein G7Z17_g11853 [Cylindrodendrum hubeiense]
MRRHAQKRNMGAGAGMAGTAACDCWIQGMSLNASKSEARLTIDFLQRIGQSLSHGTFRHSSSAQSERAPPLQRHHHSELDNGSFTNNAAPSQDRAELRRQLAADKQREGTPCEDTSREDTTREGTAPSRPSWTDSAPLRRRTERKLGMSKSWTNLSPSYLLETLLANAPPGNEVRNNTAMIRSFRLPVVLMQMRLRHEAEADLENNLEILDLLPSETQWQKVMSIMYENGHAKEDLEYYLYILLGANDEERCRRFLEQDTLKPIFILNFLLRAGSSICNISTLDGLLKYFRDRSCSTGKDDRTNSIPERGTQTRSRLAMLNLAPDEFSRLMSRFANHCRRLEPRLLTTLADTVAQRIIWHQQSPDHPTKIYHVQCTLFNSALRTFASRASLVVRHKQVPNAYFWEAQRILLGMSDQLAKPLLVDKAGFKAIRAVLAGLPKNQAEIHSAMRHSQTWPPYLRPGDGMDEKMEPDETWTRTVRAGTMMQEAGFSKDQNDEALDILQGLAHDGTPAIQQRTPVNLKKQLRVWAASIKATRNAQEAWGRFQHPPEKGQKPGPLEYAAMFEKLFARDADPAVSSVPGNNSLNFPIQQEANLAEFEKARLRAPSVYELYEKMKLNGILPSGPCLRILVSNAESLQTAHRYLMQSTMPRHQWSSLLSNHPDPESLGEIPLDIFSAYIHVCARDIRQPRRKMVRAMRLIEARLGCEPRLSAAYLWEPILKNLGQHHLSLGISVGEQLQLAIHLLQRIQDCHGFPLSLFHRFARCLKSILRREVVTLLGDLESDDGAVKNPLSLLYDPDAREVQITQEPDPACEPPALDENEDETPLTLTRLATTRLKDLFDELVVEEKERQGLLRTNEVSQLDAMLLRRDPVSAPIVHDYMLFLAFAGEFKEMARVVKWLMHEWGQGQLIEELEALDEVPYEADMLDTLCVFRAFAEPMLEQATVDSVLEALNISLVGWTWPDDDLVQGYLDGRLEDEANKDLSEVLEWVRQQQRQRRLNRDTANTDEDDDDLGK